jgi:hypothetical protein
MVLRPTWQTSAGVSALSSVSGRDLTENVRSYQTPGISLYLTLWAYTS